MSSGKWQGKLTKKQLRKRAKRDAKKRKRLDYVRNHCFTLVDSNSW